MSRKTGSRNAATMKRADDVFDLIYNADDTKRLTRFDIADQLGCSTAQASRAIEVIKDVLSAAYAEPIIFHWDVGYRFGDTLHITNEYILGRLRIAKKQHERLLTGTIGPLRNKFPRSSEVRSAEKQLVRFIEDADDLIATMV